MQARTIVQHSTTVLYGEGSSLGVGLEGGNFWGAWEIPVPWDKGQPRPCQTQPHSSWVPQVRQVPNVSSCWAGKMIPNNSPINRLRRGGTGQDGARWPPPSRMVSKHVLNVMRRPREGSGQNNSPLCCKEAAGPRVGSQELGNWEESLARGLDQHELCWRGCRVLPMLWSPGGPHPAFARTPAWDRLLLPISHHI